MNNETGEKIAGVGPNSSSNPAHARSRRGIRKVLDVQKEVVADDEIKGEERSARCGLALRACAQARATEDW